MTDYGKHRDFIPFSYITSFGYHVKSALAKGFKPGYSILSLFRDNETIPSKNPINTTKHGEFVFKFASMQPSGDCYSSLVCPEATTDGSNTCVQFEPGDIGSAGSLMCAVLESECHNGQHGSQQDLDDCIAGANAMCTDCVGIFILPICCVCTGGQLSVTCPLESPYSDGVYSPDSVATNFSIHICEMRRANLLANPDGYDDSCFPLCNDCPEGHCYNSGFNEVCWSSSTCNEPCNPCSVPEDVCDVPIWCPCTNSFLWNFQACPSVCCDPSVEGCVECCSPQEGEGCGNYIWEDMCCETCEPCVAAGGISIPSELCEEFTCALCAFNPNLIQCTSQACKQCDNGEWVLSTQECITGGCSSCAHDPNIICEGCTWCAHTFSWIPEFVYCHNPQDICPNPLNPACGVGDPIMCYSYSQSDPIYYNPHPLHPSVTLTYTKENGGASGSEFSYGSIATLCEVPDEFQLCVFVTKLWDPNDVEPTERQLTYGEVGNEGFTLNPDQALIILNIPLGPADTMIIRRCSEDNKMLFHFTDGAKLSAKDLNASLHQLLFLIQEKEFATKTINEHFPLPNVAEDWSNQQTYENGDFASYQRPQGTDGQGNPIYYPRVIYKCIAETPVGDLHPPLNQLTWELDPNWTVVAWLSNGFVIDGGQDLNGPIIFSLHGIDIGDALVWNGYKFVGQPLNLGSLDDLFDVNASNPVDGDILVFNGSNNEWRNSSNINWPISTNTMTINDNLFLGDWGFYKALQPGDTLDKSYTGRPEITTLMAPGSTIQDFRDNHGYWVVPNPPSVVEIAARIFPSGDPNDLFNRVTDLENSASNTELPIVSHLSWNMKNNINNLSDSRSMFWATVDELYNRNGLNLTLGYTKPTLTEQDGAFWYTALPDADVKRSTIWGYGLSNTNLTSTIRPPLYLNVPESRTNTFNLPSYTSNGSIRIYNDTETIHTHDNYLKNIRDLAFSSGNISVSEGTTDEEYIKLNMASQLYPAYDLGTMDVVTFTHYLPTSSSDVDSVHLKIPDNLTYVNNIAAFLGAYDTDTGASLDLEYTISQTRDITPKDWGDTFLPLWTSSKYSIQWLLTGLSKSSIGVGLQAPTNPLNAETWPSFNAQTNNWDYTGTSTDYFPDANNYNSNDVTPVPQEEYDPRVVDFFNGTLPLTGESSKGIGDTSMLIDVNKLFSEASSLIPEPRDIYVFNVGLQDNISTAIYTSGLEPARAHVMLDWGLHDIYTKESNYSTEMKKIFNLLKKEDIRVWTSPVIHEDPAAPQRGYIKLYIEVPRVKYIGYSNFARKNAGTLHITSTLNTWYSTHFPSTVPAETPNDLDKIIGLRNEAGIRFTRLGIPSNLWIKLSVMRTKASTSLL